MNTSLFELAAIGSPTLCAPDKPDGCLSEIGNAGRELAELLALKNGFYAYESALLVRPMRSRAAPLGLFEWNRPDIWRTSYETETDGLFFAEDIFGVQFCIRNGEIFTFDPETGVFERLCGSISEWARDVQENPNRRTGHSLARAWQVAEGVLKPGERLLPKVPFVMGGAYEIQNLHRSADAEGMRFRASIANQIRHLPDGSKVILKVRAHG